MNNRGFIAITTVLIVAAVVLSIGITVSFLSIGEGQSALALTEGENSLNLAEGCMEDAILKIRDNSSYAGGSITRPEGNCQITINNSGGTYTISSVAISTSYRRTIQVIVTKGTSLVISSWKEI